MVGAVWAFPTAWVLFATFWHAGHFTVANLSETWAAAPFGRYALNTAVIVGGLFVVQAVFGAVAGFVLARYPFPGKGVVTALFLLQVVVPVYAVLIQEYRIVEGLHLLNTKVGIMLPYAVSGIAVLTYRQAFRAVPRELEEAARLDGYGTFGVFRHVYLPRALPATLAFAVVSVTYHWTDFLWPLMVTDSDSARPIAVGLAMLAQASEAGLQWRVLAAATAVVVVPVLALFAAFHRRILAALTTGLDW